MLLSNEQKDEEIKNGTTFLPCIPKFSFEKKGDIKPSTPHLSPKSLK